MKIALISPRGAFLATQDSFVEFFESTENMARFSRSWAGLSAALPIIAALTPREWDITILDEKVDEIDFDESYDLVAISLMTQQAKRGYEIADRFREKGIPVVLGGIHVTVMPDEASQHADYIICGEAESVWPSFIKDFEAGKAQKVYTNSAPVELEEVPLPRYDLLEDKNYSIVWIQTTRGCPHDCYFCAASKIFGTQYRTKPIPQVIAEIQEMKKYFPQTTLVGFSDDNFFINANYTSELLKEVAKENIHWVTQTDISFGQKPELMKLAKEAGCVNVFIGFESINEQNLNDINENNWKRNKLDKYREYIQNIQLNGIGVMGSFILGLPHDRSDVFKQVSDFIIDNHLVDSQISILTPLPGTDLFKRMEANGEINSYNWEEYSLTKLLFDHPNFTKEQIEEGLVNIYKAVNTDEVYMGRMEYYKKIFKIARKRRREAKGK